jgi:hypothetical protein
VSITVTTTKTVGCCHECPRVHNSVWDHDDPFTAAPVGSWGCTEPGGPTIISDTYVIHARCPLNKPQVPGSGG